MFLEYILPVQQVNVEDDSEYILPVQQVNVEDNSEYILPVQQVNVEDDSEYILPVQQVNVEDDSKYILPVQQVNAKDDSEYILPVQQVNAEDDSEYFISTLPIIIAEKNINISIESTLRLKNDTLDIKNMKSHIYLTSSKVLPMYENHDNKSFINIQKTRT
ncbi:hypothetical protein G9F73_002905 [Clostridium estertheticum]|uniref:DUF7852 domain-containing protein n=1 Tax=Clostridium estertheticum TaxID=238834 RepID=UPI001CC9F765|nr:hypothetical protein [Clostridium estertheticum]MBZ9606786.1 hypothetical protein [Clostridium estertheticum]